MSLSFFLGVLVIVSCLMIKEGAFQKVGIPVPIEEMFERSPQSNAGAPVLDQRLVSTPQRPVPQIIPWHRILHHLFSNSPCS
jgi:hypothetical protein